MEIPNDQESHDEVALPVPEEVMFAVLSKLGPKDLCRASQVNKEWKRFGSDPQLWRELTVSNLEMSSVLNKRKIPQDSLDWKIYYRDRTLINNRWKSGKPIKNSILRGHTETVFCVKLMEPNRLVSAGADGRVIFFDIAKQQTELIMSNEVGMLGLAYDSETSRIATGGFDGSVRLINANFEKREKLPTLSVKELKEVLKAKRIDFSDCFEKSDLVKRIENSRAMSLAEVAKTYHPHTGVVVGVDLKGNMLATGSRDSNIKIRNVEADTEIVLRGHLDAVNAVQLYDNCTKAVSGANDTLVKLWDVTKNVCVKNISGHQAWVWGLELDPQNKTLITNSVDTTTRIWDLNSGRCVQVLANPNAREVAGLSADFTAQRLVTGSFDSQVRIWDLRTFKCLSTFNGHSDRVTRVSMNEDLVASASFDGTVRIWSFV